MRIAVDIDGCCYTWESAARYMLRTYKGYGDELKQESQSWDWIERRVRPADWAWLWNDGVSLGLFRYGHVVTGAIVGVRALAEKHEIVAVTHRPRSAVRDTVAWFSYIDLPFSGYHILSDNQPKTQVDADLLIDDKPENILEWAIAGRQALLFDTPWNQGVQASNVIRCRGWKDVVDCVGDL